MLIGLRTASAAVDALPLAFREQSNLAQFRDGRNLSANSHEQKSQEAELASI
jgi:hypothetical protein